MKYLLLACLLFLPVSVSADEMTVKMAFPNTPVLWFVAECESGYRQHKDGEVLKGVVNSLDTGVFQVNKKYHLNQAKRLNLDINTLAGNIMYTAYLYEKEGLQPWSASKHCWLPKLQKYTKKNLPTKDV